MTRAGSKRGRKDGVEKAIRRAAKELITEVEFHDHVVAMQMGQPSNDYHSARSAACDYAAGLLRELLPAPGGRRKI